MLDRELLKKLRKDLAKWCKTDNKTIKYRKKPWGKKKKKKITQHKFDSNEALLTWITLIDGLLGESGGTNPYALPSDVEFEEMGIAPSVDLRNVEGGVIKCGGIAISSEESMTVSESGYSEGSKVVVIGDGKTSIFGETLTSGAAKMYVRAGGQWKKIDMS